VAAEPVLSADEVARLGAVSRRTAERHLNEFRHGELEATRTVRWRGPASELCVYHTLLEQDFRARPPCTIGEACTRIERLTGVKRQASQVRQFLKNRLHLKWRRVTAISLPSKFTLEENVQKQAEFSGKKLTPVLQAARAKRLLLYFVDAAHFVQGSYLSNLWSAAVLFVRAASGRQRDHALGCD